MPAKISGIEITDDMMYDIVDQVMGITDGPRFTLRNYRDGVANVLRDENIDYTHQQVDRIADGLIRRGVRSGAVRYNPANRV